MNTQEIKSVVDELVGAGSFDQEVQQIEQLRQVLNKFTGRSLEFASSLINQYDTRGSLSDKQMYWVNVLYKQQEEQAKQAEQPKLEFPRIQEMFQRAATTLKRMKVELKAGDQRVVFKRAGEASKYSGSIMITDGGVFGENKLFGMINLDGEFKRGRDCTDAIVELLNHFNEDPELVAMQYGRENHLCCFCMKQLRDKRSTDVGYGPVCAERWGLQWG